MVAVINGLGLGLYNNTSLNPAGSGQTNPTLGQFGDRVYVNGRTGNLVIQQQDEFLASIGLDTALLRTYNSQGTWDGDNNDNWRLGSRSRIHGHIPGDEVTKTCADGAEIKFTYIDTVGGIERYRSTDGSGAHDTLEYNTNPAINTWTWTDGTSAVTEVYEADAINGGWRLFQCKDADGNTTTYGYHATSGLLTQITDQSGQVITLSYNASSQLTSIATSSNSITQTRVSYTYEDNRLKTVTVDLTPENTSDSKTFVTTYGYDAVGRVNSITHTGGTTLSFTYDAEGRVESVTDGSNRTTELFYGNPNQTDITDDLGRTTSYRFDAQDRLIETLSPQLLSGERLSTQYQYDADDNIVRVIDAKGNAVDYVYADGKLMEERDALGNTIRYTYTASNQIATRTVYRTPDPDGSGTAQPQQPLTTHYIYDGEDHLLYSVTPEGGVTEYRYNTNGSLQSRLTFTANAYTGSTLTEAALDAWVATADLTKLHRTEYQYDILRGQLSQQTTYAQTDSAGEGVSGTASTVQYVYDQAGRLLSTVDANNHQTVFQYDGLGRMTQTTDALNHVTTTTYDDLGNRSIIEYANGLHRISTFDATGRLLSITETDDTETQILGKTHYAYDAAGRLRAVQNPNGIITHTLYDAAGRVSATIDGTGALTENIYDKNGNLIRTISYATAVSGTSLASLANLDAQDELESVNEVALASLRPASTAHDRINHNVYDAAGKLRITIDAQGYISEYRYDGTGALIETVAHGTAFPGLGDVDTVSGSANDAIAVDWTNVQTTHNPDGSITLLASGLENGQQVKIDIDLAANLSDSTVTITVLRQPEQMFPTENGSTTDTRTTVQGDALVTVNDYLVDVAQSNAYVADSRGVTTSTSSASVTNTNNRAISGVTQSGSNYYTGYSNSSAYNISFVVKNAQNVTVLTGTGWGPVGNTSFPEDSYTVIYSWNYNTTTQVPTGYGGYTTNTIVNNGGTARNYSIDDTKITTIDIPQQGASSIDFYYRDSENSGSWTAASDTSVGSNFRVTFENLSSTRYYKIIYKDESGNVFAMGKGSIANSAAGINTISSISFYALNSSTTGSSVHGLLDMNQVGQFGADVDGTLEYIDVTVSGGGLSSPITTRTYPEILRDILGSSQGNVINLKLGTKLADGTYNVTFHGAYRSGSGHTITQILTGVTTVQIGPQQVKELTWSETSVPNISNFTQAKFFYRPANETTAQFTELQYTTSISNPHLYFVKQLGTFKVHFIGYAGVEYEYRVEYRNAGGTLLNTLEINGSGDSAVLHSSYERVGDYSGITPSYVSDTQQVLASTVSINVENTANPNQTGRTLSGATQSGGNYYLSNWSNPGTNTTFVVKNAQDHTVMTGGASSGPVGNTSFPHGTYTVIYKYTYTVLVPTGYGGYWDEPHIGYKTYTYSVIDEKLTTLNIPKQGASNIEFYYRAEGSAGGWTQVSAGMISSTASLFKVVIPGISGNKQFKVVYKDSGNQAFAQAKGDLANTSIGTNTTSELKLYTLSQSTEGSSLNGLLDMSRVGAFGDSETGDLQYIQVVVSGNGLPTLTTYTYPEAVRDLTGNNRIYLSFDELPNGRYNIEIYAKYYNNPDAQRILPELTSIQVGQKEYHQQTLSWPESAVENLEDVATAGFFYRPAGSAANVPFIQVRLGDTAGELAGHFIRENGRFSAQLFDLQQTQYEYFVKYWDSNGRLLNFIDPAAALPTFTVNGAASTNVKFSHHVESTASATGSRLDGYLSAAELAEIDYLSVDVIDDVTGIPYRENVITIPHLNSANAGDLNLTTDAPLPEGRYRIVVTRHYKDGADGVARAAIAMPAFIHEIGMKPVVSYAGNIEEQGDIISLRFAEHLNWLPAQLSGNQALAMVLDAIADELNAGELPSRIYRDENGLLVGVLDTSGVLVDNADTAADIAIDNSSLQFDWETFLSSSANTETLLTGLANGQQIQLALNLAQGISDSTVDITIRRPADNDYASDASATTDTRVESNNTLSVGSAFASTTLAYHADAANISFSTLSASVSNTNRRTLSGVTQSGSSYYLSGWSNPGSNTTFVVKNSQNQTVASGGASSGPVGNTGFSAGTYTVTYTYNYTTTSTTQVSNGYGGYTTQTTTTTHTAYQNYSYSIVDDKITTIDIPKQGAASIDFYYRNSENSGSWTAVSDTSVGTNFRVTFENISSTKYYKIIYRDASNNIIAMGKGSIANSAVGTNPTSSISYYAWNGSSGASLYSQLTMSQVGEFGADVDGTLEYVDVTVSGGGLASPITTRTYPELSRDLSGLNGGNVLNLRLGQPLDSGTYSVSITRYYRSGSGHTTSSSNMSINVWPGNYNQQTLTWSGASLQNLADIASGTFYYRPVGSSGAFTQLQMGTSAGGVTSSYFLKNGNDFTARVFDIAVGDYQYYVMYRDVDGRLVDYINPQGVLPTFSVGASSSGNVTFKQLDYGSASTTGTRALGYLDNLTAAQLAAIDYLSVNVVELDYLGNVIGPYRQNVLTVPGTGAGSNTDLNLTIDGALPEGRYRIDVATYYKPVNGSVPASQSTNFIHEVGIQKVAEYSATVDLQIDDIFINFTTPVNGAHLPTGFGETDLMAAVVGLMKNQFTVQGQSYLDSEVYYDNNTALTGNLGAQDYASANTITSAILDWENLVIPADENGGFNVVLEEVGTDRVIQVNVDLAANPQDSTAQVNVLRQPEQSYEFDSFSRLDTRTEAGDDITLHSVLSPVTSASESSPNHFADAVSVQKSSETLNVTYAGTQRKLYGVTQSGSSYNLSGWSNPGPNTTFIVKNSQNQTVMTGGASSGPVGNTGFPEGTYTVTYRYNYTVRVETGYGGYWNETRTGYQTYTYTIDDTKEIHLNIPKAAAYAGFDFQYRDSGSSGDWKTVQWSDAATTGDRIKDMGSYCRVTVDLIGNSNNQEFRIYYKDAQSNIVRLGKGVLENPATAGTGAMDLGIYSIGAGGGSTLHNILDIGAIGAFGDNIDGTYEYIEAQVSGGNLSQPITTLTYPEVVRHALGLNQGRLVNLSLGQPLADGNYSIVITGYARDGENLVPVELLNQTMQIGLALYDQQTIRWSTAEVDNISEFSRARFFYRPATSQGAFTAVEFDASPEDARTYFTRDGGDFKVNLFDLDAGNYQYFVKYWDASGRLLNTIGDPQSPGTFVAGAATQTLDTGFSYNVDSTASASGTRLIGYLQNSELATIDHVSVDVFDLQTNQYYRQNVLTIPHVESSYPTDLNLTADTPLSNGRYRIEVTKYYKDDANGNPVAPVEASFIHEVGLQTVVTNTANVSVSGDVITIAFNGNLDPDSTDELAGAVNLEINRATGTAALNALDIEAGIYRYRQQVTYGDVVLSESTGRFAAYAGATPEVELVEKYYGRDKVVAVTVTDDLTESTRGANPLPAYDYANTAQGVRTQSVLTVVEDGLTVFGKSGHNPVITWSSSHRPGAAGSTVFRYKRIDQNIEPKAVSVINTAGEQSISLSGILPGTYTYVLEYRNGNDIVKTGTGSFTVVAGDTRQSDIVFEQYIEVADSLSGISLIPKSGISVDYPAGTQMIHAWVVDSATGEIVNSADGSPAVTDVADGYDGRINLRLGEDGIPAGRYDIYVQFFTIVNGVSRIFGDAPPPAALLAQSLEYQQYRVNTEPFSLIGDTAHAWFYDADSGELLYSQAIDPSASSVVFDAANYGDGNYRVRLTSFQTAGTGSIPLETHSQEFTVDTTEPYRAPYIMGLEVGGQSVYTPSTEVRWDASQRPKNTDVYFRYKAVAETEYDPQNLWIRATASRDSQGDYYVRFPQVTPDGKQQLDPLVEGQYDYVIIYVDRQSGQEVESASGRFVVAYESTPGNATTRSHEIVFGADSEVRRGRKLHDANGQLTGEVDAAGYLTEHVYDAGGRLIRTIRYATETPAQYRLQGTLAQLRPQSDAAKDLTTHYFYDNQGRQVGVLDAEGYLTKFTYDAAGNLSEEIRYANKANAYTGTQTLAQLIPTSNVNDRSTAYTYTALNQVQTMTTRAGTTDVSTTEYVYDVMGNRIRTATAANTEDERISWSGYDLQGRLVARITDGDTGELAQFESSNPTATAAELNAEILEVANDDGIFRDYDAIGQLKNARDQKDSLTRYYYDAGGRIVFEINAAGEIVERVYNNFGQMIQSIQYATRIEPGELSSFMGGLLTQSVRNNLVALRDAENDSVIQQAYDTRGLVISRTDQLGYQTSLHYNAFGEQRFEREILKGGATDGYLYETEYLYDSRGLRTNILNNTLGEQFNQGFDYDAFGRTQASYTYGNSTDGVLYNHYFNRYDRLGRTTETLEVLDSKLNHINRIAQYSYDAFNRKLTQSDANGKVTEYVYNDAACSMTITTPEGVSVATFTNVHGEKVSVTDGNGHVINFEYDKNGRLVLSADGEGNSVHNQYDAAGNLELAYTVDTNNTVTTADDVEVSRVAITYDAVNRMLTRTVDPSGSSSGVGLNLETSYKYDAKGQLIESTDPQGVITRTLYDNKGQVISVIVDAAPAGATEEEAAGYLSLVTNYTYDGRGRRLSVEQGGSNRWVTEQAEHIFLRALRTTHYEYDIHGRLIREIADPTLVTSDPDDIEHTFEGLNIVTEYGYDAAGNRNSVANARGFTTEYVYDQFGRVRFTLSPVGAVNQAGSHVTVVENRYDAAGNLVQVIQYAQPVTKQAIAAAGIEATVAAIDSAENRVTHKVYDADNRLVYSISPQGAVTEYRYDGNNNIVSQLVYPQSVDTSNGVPAELAQFLLLQSQQESNEIRQSWSVYDANGRAVYNVNALGFATANDYDANGNLLRSTRYATAIDTVALQNSQNMRAYLAATLVADGDDRTTRYAYDAAGRLVYTLDAEGYLTANAYNLYELNAENEFVVAAAGVSNQATQTVRYADPITGLSAIPTLEEIADRLEVLYEAGPGADDHVSYTLYDNAGRAILTLNAQGHAESFVYDQIGNRIQYTNGNGAQWNYVYDAANRLIEERSPEVDVTRLDATVWEQSFDANSSGLVGTLTGDNEAYRIDDGRLTLRTTGSEEWLSLLGNTGDREFSEFEHHLRFEFDITLGANPSQIRGSVGASNGASGDALRYHRLLVESVLENGVMVGKLYAEYRYRNESGVIVEGKTLLGPAVAEGSYLVEVASHSETVDGIIKEYTTLYVYRHGQSRDEGYSDQRLAVAWTDAYSEIRSYTGMVDNLDSLHINGMREVLPRERAMFDEGTYLSDRASFESIVTRYEYNVMGDVTARIEAAGTEDERRTEYSYDSLNRQVATRFPTVSVYTYGDAGDDYVASRTEVIRDDLEERTYFDIFGNAIAGVDVAGNDSYKVYDSANRLKYEVDANGFVTERVYNIFGEVEQLIRYAVAVNLTPANISDGLSLSAVQTALALLPAAENRILTTEYDLLGRARLIEQPSVTVASVNSSSGQATLSTANPTTKNEYNAFGQVTKQSTLANGGLWIDTHFYYDQKGNRIGQLDAGRYLTVWSFDDAGNVTRQTEYARSLGDPAATGNEYDPADYAAVLGKVQAHIPSTGNLEDTLGAGFDREVAYDYDHLNRVISKTQVHAVVTGGDSIGYTETSNSYSVDLDRSVRDLTTLYTYDAVGNQVSETDTKGNIVFRFYDALGRVTGQTEVTRAQQQVMLSKHTPVVSKQTGKISWARPPVGGLQTEVRVRVAGKTLETDWVSLTVQQTAYELSASLGALPSDRYEYQIRYTRVGETEVYAETAGTIDILGTTSSGSTYMVHRMFDDGDTLRIYGRTGNLSHIVINGNNYYATSAAGGVHTFDLSSLARGNYTFTTVRTGEAATTPGHVLKGSFQKTTGNITGGAVAIQTVDIELGFEIEEQMYYKYNSSSNNPRWRGENILVVTSSIPRQMGANDMRFDVTLEFINEQGKTTERTFNGYWTDFILNPSNPDKITIRDLITNDYIDIEDSRYMAKLSKIVSFKLSRTDGSGAPIYNSRSASRVETLIKQNAARYALASMFSWVDANGSAARKRELVLEATGHVDTQQLEFINLPANAKSAVFEYRLEGIEGSGGWARKSLDKIGSGHFATGNQDIPAGKYEYRIKINGSSTPIVQGHNLTIGKDITANTTVSMPEIYQTLSFDGLATSAQSAKLAYRLGKGAWAYKSLALVEPGVFATNSMGMKNGIYEYRIFLDGSATAAQSGNDLLVSDTRETLFTPLTTYQLDIFGNQVKQTEHVTSATFNADGTVNILEDDNKDRTTYNYYDNYSRKLQTQDAMGHSRFFAYDIKGNLAKEWQWAKPGAGSQVAGGLLMSGNVYRYDAMGRQIETIEIAETMSVSSSGITSGSRDYVQVKTTAQYNSFGEMTQRRLYLEGDDRIEYYQYDNAGRVWRTNDKDGVGKIYLYDVQGNVAQVLTSHTTDLNGGAYDEYSELANAVNAGGIRVNSQYYDELGNMTRQLLPGRVQNGVTIQPETEHDFDRWGNVISQTENGTTTQFKYDQFNNLIKKVDAAGTGVEVVSANASNIISVNSNATPTTRYHYDELGRAIGIVDANGNVRANYLDQAGQMVAQIAGDGGVKQYVYNIFGEQIEKISYRGSTGANPNSTWLVYDSNGRLLSEYAATGSEMHYTYDEAGNRASASRLEKLYADGSKRFVVTLYRYDNRGNLIEEIQNEEFRTFSSSGILTQTADISDSQTRRYLYDVQNRKILERMGSLTAGWAYDGFGRLTDHDDFGIGADEGVYEYDYNAAGQITEERLDRGTQTGTKTYQYFADGLLKSLARTGAATDNFEYDASGRVTRQYGSGGLYDTTYSYDALGRLEHVSASSMDLTRGSGAGARNYYLDLNYQYDAVGNRRSVIGNEGWRPSYTTTYTDAYTGQQVTETTSAATLNSINQWYTYDGENRVLISRGHLSSNEIRLSNNVAQSVKMSYDKAGNKTGSQFYRDNSLVQNTFIYDFAGNLVATAEGGHTTSERTFDLLGRQTQYIKYSSPGTASEQQNTEYFDNGLQYRVRSYDYDTSNGATDLLSTVTYSYDTLGNVAGYTLQVIGDDDNGYTNNYQYQYVYHDSALVDYIAAHQSAAEEDAPELESNTITHHYDIFGNLTSLTNSHEEEVDENRSFIYNASGQMLEKKQVSKYQHYYYHQNQALGNGGHFAPADFDFGFKDLSEASGVASMDGSYTVRPGDSLQSIALAVYGDSQFWYLIADANGISGSPDAALEPGQTLRTPKVTSARNSTETFRAFSLGEAIGNTTPNLPLAPPPPVADSGGGSSNPIVAIIAIIVTVVVAIYAPQLLGTMAEAWGGAAGAMFGAAMGNIAGQAINIIGGNQDGFNGKSLLTDTLTAGITSGIGKGFKALEDAKKISKTTSMIVQAGLNSVVSQGVAIATGQQEEFSWASVAVAVIAAPINDKIDKEMGTGRYGTDALVQGSSGKFGTDFISGFLKGAASNGVQILVNRGGKMELGMIAANAFGQALGNSILKESKLNTLAEDAYNYFQKDEADVRSLDQKELGNLNAAVQWKKQLEAAELMNSIISGDPASVTGRKNNKKIPDLEDSMIVTEHDEFTVDKVKEYLAVRVKAELGAKNSVMPTDSEIRAIVDARANNLIKEFNKMEFIRFNKKGDLEYDKSFLKNLKQLRKTTATDQAVLDRKKLIMQDVRDQKNGLKVFYRVDEKATDFNKAFVNMANAPNQDHADKFFTTFTQSVITVETMMAAASMSGLKNAEMIFGQMRSALLENTIIADPYMNKGATLAAQNGQIDHPTRPGSDIVLTQAFFSDVISIPAKDQYGKLAPMNVEITDRSRFGFFMHEVLHAPAINDRIKAIEWDTDVYTNLLPANSTAEERYGSNGAGTAMINNMGGAKHALSPYNQTTFTNFDSRSIRGDERNMFSLYEADLMTDMGFDFYDFMKFKK